jgi:ABC-2 type transport system permease protein
MVERSRSYKEIPMNIKRIAILVSKEFRYGSKNTIFFFAVIVPIALSLFISLLVGTLFAGRPRLGVADLGESQLVQNLSGLDYIRLREYNSSDELREDVARGALDMGLVLPAAFDADLQAGETPTLDVYTWGESLLKHRTTLGATLVRESIALAGYEVPVETNIILLGEEASVPWDVRLFPLVVIMTIVLGGTMVPATFVVQEKEKRTLQALLVTPVSLGEAMAAKGLAGVIISLVMGVIILTINGAWGGQPLTLLILLILSATMASAGGIILGLLVMDFTTLFTAIKSIGILLYAPAIIYIFPEVPAWIRRVFPTYYMIGPIVEVSLNNAGWGQIYPDVIILCVLIAVTVGIAALILRRINLAAA